MKTTPKTLSIAIAELHKFLNQWSEKHGLSADESIFLLEETIHEDVQFAGRHLTEVVDERKRMIAEFAESPRRLLQPVNRFFRRRGRAG